MTAIAVGWLARESPLTAVGVAALGPAATQLAASTRDRLEAGDDLRVARGEGWLLVLGDEMALPWAEHAVYLGWDCGVLTPTVRRPSVAPDLVRASLSDSIPAGCDLVVLLPGAVLATRTPTGRAVASEVEVA